MIKFKQLPSIIIYLFSGTDKNNFFKLNLCFSDPLDDSYDECQATADWLLSNTKVRPTVGIVCGSGLGRLAEMLKDPQVFNYSDIPNFPQSTGISQL